MKPMRLKFEQLETRRVMAADWTNADNALDVNDSGLVTPLDVLLVTNDINVNGMRTLPELPDGTVAPALVDVNADNMVSALDVLQIVNAINFYVTAPTVNFANASPAAPTSEFVGEALPGTKVLVEQLAAVLPVRYEMTSNAEGELDPIDVGAMGGVFRVTVTDPLGNQAIKNLEFQPGTTAPVVSSINQSSAPTIGQAAPAVNLKNQNGVDVSLADKVQDGTVVLYFYPKDNTPKCTVQAQDLRNRASEIEALGATILGVSVDPVDSHLEFAGKYDLNFDILADDTHAVSRAYGVLSEFNGMPIALRTTFIIGSDGVIKEIFRDVDVTAHSQRVVEALKNMNA